MRPLGESEKVLEMSKNKPAAKKIRLLKAEENRIGVSPFGSCSRPTETRYRTLSDTNGDVASCSDEVR